MTKPAGNDSLSEARKALLARRLAEKGLGRDRKWGIPRRDPSAHAPLSYAQQRLWYVDRMGAGPTYNMQIALRLRGRLDVGALCEALDAMVERHEVLRTGFPLMEGQPIQRVAERARFPLAEHVLSLDGDDAAQRAELDKLIRDDLDRLFDLSEGPLFRGTLLRRDEQEHVLLLTTHHAVSDGWSMGIFQREFSELYGAFSRGELPELAPLPIQYADFAVWQRDWLASGALEEQLTYWRHRLRGAATLELLTDHARPTSPSFRGAVLSHELPADLTRDVESLARDHDATPFMAWLAAFQLLLGRMAGQDDVVVGSPIANRNRAELEGLIGFFVNSLVLRLDLSGDPTVAELIERARRVATGAYGHQDVPFEEIVRDLDPERDASRNPFFQVMFSVEEDARLLPELDGLDVSPIVSSPRGARFDLEVEVRPGDDGARLRIIYAQDLFDAATVERMAGHFETLLGAMAKSPDARISTLPLLRESEARTLLVDWNDTATDFPRDASVHALFQRQAAATPDAVALEIAGESLRYGELAERATRLAHALRRRGVKRGDLVGLCLHRSADLVVSLLAVLEAGAAYVPLDPDYPEARIAFMVEDADAKLIVAHDDLTSRLPSDASLLVLDRDDLDGEETELPKGDAEDLAYVIYTSGSTGKPKAAAIVHRAISRLVLDTNYVDLGPGHRIGQISNVSFDAATFEIYGALLTGATLVGVDRDTLLSPRDLAETLRSQRIDTAFLTTALFNQTVREVPDAFATLKQLLFGGEAVDVQRVREVLEHGRPERLLHVYGPTESTTYATAHPIEEQDVEAGATTIPIGTPIANTTAYVLDAALQPVPVGVPGELYLGGDGLARGYLDRPALTAERFVPNPFTEKPGARLYRTGDRVRRRADGAIEFLGRVDHQVKLRGFRIELGEVETAIAAHDGVEDVVVVLREDTPGNKRLVAYVVGPDDDALSSLRDELRRRLPAYMVPAVFQRLDELPLDPNGKVDRKALPQPGRQRDGGERGRVAPRTDAEKTVAAIWCDLLDVEDVGVHDNFFDLGGHSLLFTQVVVALEEAFGRKLEQREMLFRTLEQIAAICEGRSLAPESESTQHETEAAQPAAAPARAIDALFFGPASRTLFGCHHAPRGELRDTAIVLCQPMSEEYVHFHRAFRQLASDLSAEGFPVLRFDFYGCGDSSGESEDADLASWRADVDRAIDEVLQRTGLARVCLVGFRLGASLALLAGAERSDVDGLVLLDPVVRGDEYLDELRSWHDTMLRVATVRGERFVDAEEILGFAHGPGLVTELAALDLASANPRAGLDLLVVESREAESTGPLRARLRSAGANVAHRHVPHIELWERTDRFQLEDVNRVQMPRWLMQSAILWVTERYA